LSPTPSRNWRGINRLINDRLSRPRSFSAALPIGSTSHFGPALATPNYDRRAAQRRVGSVALSSEQRGRVEEAVRRMIAELRTKPTQAKEDRLGLEIATLPPEEREYATTVLLQILVEERGS